MELQEKLDKIRYIANTISPYNYYALGYLDNFYLAYYKDYEYYNLKEIRDYWLDYFKEHSQVYINFYIHIPFCEVGCAYCKYYKDTKVTSEKIDKYIDYLEKYFAFFAPVFKQIKIVNMHIGGGTPSLLSVSQLERLFGLISHYCIFDDRFELAFEINPKSITLEKLELLKKNRVNRLAIGIQSLNKEVLKTVNRDYYDFEYIAAMMANIKKLGFRGTTLDLLLGLYKDTPLTFMNTLKKTLSLEPDRIHIYVVNPPREYLIKYFDNDYNKFFKRVNNIQKVVFPMMLQLVKNTPYYTCEHLSFKKKDYDINKRKSEDRGIDPRRFGYSETVSADVGMLGFGKDAHSHLCDDIVYKDFNNNHSDFDIEKKIFYGHKFGLKEICLKKFFYNINTFGKVDIRELNKEFSTDFLEDNKDLIKYLRDNQFIDIKDEVLKPICEGPFDRFCNYLLFLDDRVIDNIYQNCVGKTYE